MLVLPELGRDGDRNASNGFLNHRSGDASCRNMWMLAMGAAVPRGETDRTVYHVDVAATAAGLLGVKASGLAGTPMRELLL
jgi:arylsulfatase A-like enzyme